MIGELIQDIMNEIEAYKYDFDEKKQSSKINLVIKINNTLDKLFNEYE